MFKTRLLSGIILILIALLTIIPGGDMLLALLVAISLIGFFEILRVFQVEKTALAFCGYGFTLLFFLSLRFSHLLPEDFPNLTWLLSLAFLIALLFILVFAYPRFKAQSVIATFFGFFYVVVFLSYIYQIRMLPLGAFSVWLIFICSWGSDTFAYCAGMLLGKRKLAPDLSPKKSVEGAIGGVLGAALLGFLFALAINAWADAHVSVLAFVIISACGAVISQVGDLAASAIKRNYEIKDFGRLIPGHGGILDRFDSVIITAPIIFYLTVVLL